MIKVAIDAMGGDNAPIEIVKGAVEAIKESDVNIVLVGLSDVINKELSKYSYDKERISVVNATEVIGTDESPTVAVRRKKDSSMIVGLKLVKEGEVSAFVSAGSTGALLTGAILHVGRINGIERPALATKLPTKGGYSLLIDSGSNVDCKPKYLEQFAKMGSVYVENVVGIKNPSVALVNIGAEKEKGNALTKEAYELLENSNLNFVGNLEARDIPSGNVNVVVCDGFVGNVILKFSEGLGMTLLKIVKETITEGIYKFAAAALKTPFKTIKKRFDPDEIGGAAFLGVKALVVKAHGSSKSKAIKNAIKQCEIFVQNDIVKKIEEKIQN